MNIVRAEQGGVPQSTSMPGWGDRFEHAGSYDLLRILRRRLRLIVVTICVIVTAALAALLLTTPKYVATSILQLEDVSAATVASPQGQDDPVRELEMKQEYNVRTQIEAIKSRPVARTVVKDLALYDDPEFNPEGYTPEKLPNHKGKGTDTVSAASQVPTAVIERTTDNLLEQLDVVQDGATSYILVTAESENPHKAVRIANKVATSYLSAGAAENKAASARAIENLSKRTENTNAELQQVESQVTEFKLRNGMDTGFAAEAGSAEIQSAAAALAVARATRAETSARATGQLAGGGVNSALLNDLRSKETTLESQLADLSTQFGRAHPDVQKISAQLNEVKGAIAAETGRASATLQAESMAAGAREGQLGGDVAGLRARARRQEAASVQLANLERNAESIRAVYIGMLGRLQELQKLGARNKPDATLVSRAVLPTSPSSPKTGQVMAVTGGGAIFFALILAVVAESLDARVRSAAQVRQITGLPTLTMIPERQSQTRPTLPNGTIADRPNSVFAESFRSGFLELMARTDRLKSHVFMVTSALPADGKSTVSLGLAAAAISTGRSAIVVDFDLRRSSISSLLGLSNESANLVTYLCGETTLEESISYVSYAGEVPKLACMAVAAPPEKVASLFTEDRLQTLFQRLRGEFEVVIVDTPPIIAVRDAKILARYADASILAVRWNKSTPDTLRLAMEILGSELSGAVITRVDFARHSHLAYGDALQHYSRYSSYYDNTTDTRNAIQRWFGQIRRKFATK